MNNLDYIKYDEMSVMQQGIYKDKCKDLLENIDVLYGTTVEGQTAIRKLEECYMWIGKAVRNAQIARGGSVLQEDRANI